jgi:hypothetical protein
MKYSQEFTYKDKKFVIETDTSSESLHEVICTGAHKAKAYCTADFLKDKIQIVYDEACKAIDKASEPDINVHLEQIGFTKV